MTERRVEIHSPAGAFAAHLVAPPSGAEPLGAVVVIQEIFGINSNVRAVCGHIAALGFTAIAPDLFWRFEPGIVLEPDEEADRKRAFELFGQFDVDAGADDIAAAIAYARGLGHAKVGAIGFCLGGLLAYLTATRTDSDATVGYYGVSIEQRLEEAEKLTRPLMLHIAGADEFVDAAAQARIEHGLKNNPHVALHHYPGRSHAFARVGSPSFHGADALLANARTYGFLVRHLAR